MYNARGSISVPTMISFFLKIYQNVQDWQKKILGTGETSKHLIKTFFLYGLIALSIIVTKVLIARLYGQTELGIFSYFFSLVTVVFLFTSLGFPEAITQVTVKSPGKLKDGFYKSILFIIPLTGLLMIPFFTLDSLFATRGLKWNFMVYILSYTFFYLTYSLLRGFKRFTECSVYSLVNRIVFIMFIILFAVFSFEFNLLLMSMSLALFIAGVIALPTIFKLWKTTPQDETVETKSYVSLAISLFLMQAGFYLLRETDNLFLPYLVGFEQQAVYSAQASMSNIIRLIAYVFPVVVLPMAVVSKYKLRQSLIKISKLLIPFSGLILLLSYVAVPLLYGAQYAHRWLPVALVISSTLLVVYSYLNSILVGENSISKFYFKIIVIDFLITAIINTGLVMVFVRYWGILGAPIATGVTVLLKIGWNWYGIRKLRGKSEEEVISGASENELQTDNHKKLVNL